MTSLTLTALIVSAALAATAHAQDGDTDKDTSMCLACHRGMEGQTASFADGSSLSLHVDPEAWFGSVHGGNLSCSDCHREVSGYPHARRDFADARAYQLAQAETCYRCHYPYYTRVLDGMHFAQLEAGNRSAPTCVDCHGAHDTSDPNAQRVEIDRKCARCHAVISKTYEQSIHGKALLEEDNQDVPVCTDCHGAHANVDPRLPAFHAREHEICIRCHGDSELMSKYGVSTRVVKTYLDDFHGKSNALYSAGAGAPDKPLATCTDCHGVHDIQPFDVSGSPAAIRGRLVQLCRRCHKEVPDAFADAWMYHYEPALATAPLVWAVRWGYRILIPLILVGLAGHILLHLWRIRFRR